MIFTNDGRCEMQGTVITLLTDLAGIIDSLHKGLVKDVGEENANWLISFAGKLGYAERSEDLKALSEELRKKMEEIDEYTSVEYERS